MGQNLNLQGASQQEFKFITHSFYLNGAFLKGNSTKKRILAVIPTTEKERKKY